MVYCCQGWDLDVILWLPLSSLNHSTSRTSLFSVLCYWYSMLLFFQSVIVKRRNEASFRQELSNICTPRGQHRLIMNSGYICRSLALRAWDTAPTSRQSRAVASAAKLEVLRLSWARLRRVSISWNLTGAGTAMLLWEITSWPRSPNHMVCLPCGSDRQLQWEG